MELKKVSVKDIIPYDNNPRKNDNAVDAVMESIKQCGYIAPIITDENMVVLAGHTRLKAIKRLGWRECNVEIIKGLTEEQKRKYRILDNKVGELAEWDFSRLEEELDGLSFDGFDFGFDDLDQEEKTNEEREQEFRERMENGNLSEDSEEYQEFLQKFEAKKTTDDCYTPDNVYAVVKDWAVKRYGLQNRAIIRPFYPGGDYQKEDYPKNCVALDNPPFSLLSEIRNWYQERGISYFLFAPALTIFSANKDDSYIYTGNRILYENGATIATAFITNMPEKKIFVPSDLHHAIEAANKENYRKQKKELPAYKYPDEVITTGWLQYIADHEIDFSVEEKEVSFIRVMDAQKESGKKIFGGGWLISEKAAAEKAAAEKAAAEKAAAEKVNVSVWELSAREKEIVRSLG
jgi:ParB-like chromosome segregation protein Spo0J